MSDDGSCDDEEDSRLDNDNFVLGPVFEGTLSSSQVKGTNTDKLLPPAPGAGILFLVY